MESYFYDVIKSLTLEDTAVLGFLIDSDATSKIKSIKNPTLYEEIGTSEAKYRKIISRLLALKFIEANTDFKEHSYYISKYGTVALSEILKTMK